MSKAAIWWTSQQDCEVLGDHAPKHLPEYIRTEYRSRLGRNGRGRLWIAPTTPELQDTAVHPWPATPVATAIETFRHGGIVIHAAHVPLVACLPGFVTDTHLNYWTLEASNA